MNQSGEQPARVTIVVEGQTAWQNCPVAVSVGVQVVLYENGLGDVWRLVRSLVRSVQRACDSGEVAGVRMLFGDCSAKELLPETALRDLAQFVRSALGVEIEYHFFNDNLMTARSHNRLSALHDSDFIFVINPDTYVQPDVLKILVTASSDPAVAAAEGRQLPLEHPKDYNPRTGDTSWASGFCVLYRHAAFAEVGGYDQTHFPLYCDDVDISWRLRLAGYRVIHVPEAGVFHDKRFTRSGHVAASPIEEYHGALARLMLATRYDRSDIARETTEHIVQHGTSSQRQAVADFRMRLRSGELPEAVEGSASVAEFLEGSYGPARY